MPSHYPGGVRETLALTTYIQLVRAAESVSARLLPGIAAAKLTESRFGVLEALHHLGPMHQCDLAERILTTSGNMTVVIRNLERRGLVRRARANEDRRFILVSLTARGEALIRRTFPKHAAAVLEQMTVLSDTEQRTLGRLCRRVGLGPGARGTALSRQ
ncbi:MAG TPA: MarR family transcriptional regulator [Gemmatimonadales bacterium]|nr:MarR family transcriptional regulator [Gemmatimonadales bacterium]